MRRAFTLIELVVVLAVVGLLAGIATPSILQAMEHARINAAAVAILRANSVAMGLARLHQPPPADAATWAQLDRAVASYGVAIDATGSEPYVVVTYGTNCAAADELPADTSGDGTPDGFVCRIPLRGVLVWKANAVDGLVDQAALGGRLGWFYRYGSGEPIATSKQLDPANRSVGIGTPQQAAALALEIVTGNALAKTTYKELIQVETAAVIASPVASHLSVRGRGNGLRVAVSIYQLGFTSTAEF